FHVTGVQTCALPIWILGRASQTSATASGPLSLDQSPTALVQSGWQWATEHVARVATDVAAGGPATTPGAWLGKVGVVMDLLVGWGHAPEVRTTPGGRQTDIRSEEHTSELQSR